MKLYFGLFAIMCYTNVFSKNNISSNNKLNIYTPHVLNGHYIKWPDKNVELSYIQNKQVIPKNIIFTRFQICGNLVFLVSPRYKEGVPFTLSHVTLSGENQCYNYVQPFPNLEKNALSNQDAIINAVDIYMDQSGILWVLDTGIINTLEEKSKTECSAKILGIDYENGHIIHNILLGHLVCRIRSRLKYIIVEYANNKPIIYVGDTGTRSIIVWKVISNEGYRVKIPRFSTATCLDSTKEDVLYMVLVEKNNCNFIYFTYLSSSDMFRVRTMDLRRRINPKCIVNLGRKPSSMIIIGSGYGSIIYFRINGINNLYSWDTKESFLEENMMLVKKSLDCRVITHLDVNNDGVLWELQSNMDDYVINTVGCFGANVILQPIFGQSKPVSSFDECHATHDAAD